MKRLGVVLVGFVFLFCVSTLPVFAADTSKEVEQLKGEVHKLLKRIDDLEKKQAETSTKVAEAEKKVEKKPLKDRIDWGGEARFRIMSDNTFVGKNFYGIGYPAKDQRFRDETSFPLRVRLNAHVEAVQDVVDFYARLTMNKRWGAYDTSATDPLNKPNSFESSIGHDMNARFEQAYLTMTLPYIDGKWYIGRLPGMDGAPQRQAGSLFPRPFIDSEIDGTLIKWNAPETFLDSVSIPGTSMRLWGTACEQGKAPVLKTYEAKVKDKTGIILGYLKYDEKKLQNTDNLETTGADADAFLAQATLKVGKDTEVIWDGLTMADWHMPQTSVQSTVSISDVKTNYVLTGVYADTQLLGFQIYGAYYYSHFSVPDHSFKTTSGSTSTTTQVEGQGFPGHMLFAGFNTGDLIAKDMQFTLEFADGSEAYIDPFNYRGYRRKGTVLYPAGNYFYDSSGKSTAGFYPFNAQVWDLYYDYYYKPNVRFRLGYIDFLYSKHDIPSGQKASVLGSSKYQHDYWPYAEINVSF
jgi:hypothetical protein